MIDEESGEERVLNDGDMEMISGYLETGNEPPIQEIMNGTTRHRRFIITKGGLMGLGHMDSRPGDKVWVFNLGNVPFTICRERSKIMMSHITTLKAHATSRVSCNARWP